FVPRQQFFSLLGQLFVGAASRRRKSPDPTEATPVKPPARWSWVSDDCRPEVGQSSGPIHGLPTVDPELAGKRLGDGEEFINPVPQRAEQISQTTRLFPDRRLLIPEARESLRRPLMKTGAEIRHRELQESWAIAPKPALSSLPVSNEAPLVTSRPVGKIRDV